jgi:dolichol-phosphate mannosyltransferase
MFSKYTLALLGPAILLFMLMDPKSRRWFFSPWPYLAVIIALIFFSPVIIWNSQHHWASFLFQSERRVEGVSHFATLRLLGQIILLLTPLGAIGLIAFFIKGRSFMAKRRFLFFLLLVAVPLAVFLFFSLNKGVKLNWTGPLWLGLIPFLAVSIAEGEGSFLLNFCRRWWQPTAWVMLIFYGLSLHFYSLGLPGIPTLKHPFLSGWDGLAHQINQIVDSAQKNNGKRPVVVGMDKYQIASGLAFYRYKDELASKQKSPAHAIAETTSWNIFGRNGLMYDYWFPPASLEGRDLLLVALSKDSIADKNFASHVRKIGPVRELNVTMNGYTINHCYVRLAQGYHHN